ncbi:MAG: hypothetical protein O4861_10755 [Trichodesmium sp. St16_bin4-tuft]|nr:hypothetical protein [Trichodesmium sp. MAG_R01]MDE5073309.1 hypothetical protein [Trichodesmium sp. St5_bin8]MDE5079656.1 hypothetical protein [Trichodesmium sp. St2_bin6]MDE5091162.1 hypothetical protein [Trichodesmium sp. St18_bin3_1_1]MDE5098784.1 hypothetical protein [Trichodesmium sp. St16_bin4-tuft]MDE5102926.1 hypothetical protein [Trichodesmium sp. St19_bin2]
MGGEQWNYFPGLTKLQDKGKKGKKKRGRALGTKARNHRGRRDDSKTPIVEEAAGIVIDTPGTPGTTRIDEPATAVEHTEHSVSTKNRFEKSLFWGFPRTTITRSTIIVIVPNILTPFLDIAVHIV